MLSKQKECSCILTFVDWQKQYTVCDKCYHIVCINWKDKLNMLVFFPNKGNTYEHIFVLNILKTNLWFSFDNG